MNVYSIWDESTQAGEKLFMSPTHAAAMRTVYQMSEDDRRMSDFPDQFCVMHIGEWEPSYLISKDPDGVEDRCPQLIGYALNEQRIIGTVTEIREKLGASAVPQIREVDSNA